MIIDFTIKDDKKKSQSKCLPCTYQCISRLNREVDKCVRWQGEIINYQANDIKIIILTKANSLDLIFLGQICLMFWD